MNKVTDKLNVKSFGSGSQRITVVSEDIPEFELLDGCRFLVTPALKKDLIDYVQATPIDDVAAQFGISRGTAGRLRKALGLSQPKTSKTNVWRKKQ